MFLARTRGRIFVAKWYFSSINSQKIHPCFVILWISSFLRSPAFIKASTDLISNCAHTCLPFALHGLYEKLPMLDLRPGSTRSAGHWFSRANDEQNTGFSYILNFICYPYLYEHSTFHTNIGSVSKEKENEFMIPTWPVLYSVSIMNSTLIGFFLSCHSIAIR